MTEVEVHSEPAGIMALEHLSDVVQRCVSTSGDMRGSPLLTHTLRNFTVIPVLNLLLLISCLILIL